MSDTLFSTAPLGQTATVSPYKGLEPYLEEDAPFFFGREDDQELIIANLRAWRLTLLYGASGVGKSSALGAGVTHELRRQAQENLERRGRPEMAVVFFNSWRDDPLVGLLKQVQDAVADAWGLPPDESLPSTPLELAEALQDWSEQVEGKLFIILDQFEEYFLYHGHEEGAGTFAYEFARAVNRLDLRVNFLISIREDALAKLDCFKGHLPGLFDNYLRIDYLDLKAARNAIEKPLEEYNFRFAQGEILIRIEPELVEAVLEQVKTSQGLGFGETGRGAIAEIPVMASASDRVATPFLQLVMKRLWEEETLAGSHTLQLQTLGNLGGVEKIIRTHLDSVMGELSESEQAIAADIFAYLVTPSGAKITYSVPDLTTLVKRNQVQLSPLLEKLSSGSDRILRRVDSPLNQPDVDRYEIYHDALANAILDWRQRYSAEQELQEQQHKAEQKLREQRQILQQRQRQLRRTQAFVGLLILLLLLLLVSSLTALFQANEAGHQSNIAGTQGAEAKSQADIANTQKASAQYQEEQAKFQANIAGTQGAEAKYQANIAEAKGAEAERQGRIAEARTIISYATLQLRVDPERSILLLLEAIKIAQQPGGEAVLLQADDILQQALLGTQSPLILRGHISFVYSAVFSPDGSKIATASNDKTAKIWNVPSSLSITPTVSITLTGHTGSVNAVAFSPDGRTVVTASSDTLAKIWDVPSGRELKSFKGHTGPVNSVAFSPDGRTIVTVSSDTLAKVWDVQSGLELKTLKGHTGPVNSVAFSPDGRTIVTASDDTLAKIWDVESGSELASLQGHTGPVNSVAFSPDGRTIVTASSDTLVKIWDLQSTKETNILISHIKGVRKARFSPDGSKIVTVGDDRLAKIWNSQTGQILSNFTFLEVNENLTDAWFSPDGRILLVATNNGTVKQVTVRSDDLLKLAQKSVTRQLTANERKQFGLGPPSTIAPTPTPLSTPPITPSIDPNEAFFNAGKEAVDKKDWQAAIASFEKIPTASPIFARAKPLLVTAYTSAANSAIDMATTTQQGNTLEAAQKTATLFKKALDLDPDNAELKIASNRAETYSQARAQYDNRQCNFAITPLGVLYSQIKTGSPDGRYRDTAELYYNCLVGLGDEQFQQANLSEARDWYSKALAITVANKSAAQTGLNKTILPPDLPLPTATATPKPPPGSCEKGGSGSNFFAFSVGQPGVPDVADRGSSAIQGRVLNRNRQPIAGATVLIFTNGYSFSATTDGGGNYYRGGLGRGVWTVQVVGAPVTKICYTAPASVTLSGQAGFVATVEFAESVP